MAASEGRKSEESKASEAISEEVSAGNSSATVEMGGRSAEGGRSSQHQHKALGGEREAEPAQPVSKKVRQDKGGKGSGAGKEGERGSMEGAAAAGVRASAGGVKKGSPRGFKDREGDREKDKDGRLKLSSAELLLLLSPSIASTANLATAAGPYSCKICQAKFPSLHALGYHQAHHRRTSSAARAALASSPSTDLPTVPAGRGKRRYPLLAEESGPGGGSDNPKGSLLEDLPSSPAGRGRKRQPRREVPPEEGAEAPTPTAAKKVRGPAGEGGEKSPNQGSPAETASPSARAKQNRSAAGAGAGGAWKEVPVLREQPTSKGAAGPDFPLDILSSAAAAAAAAEAGNLVRPTPPRASPSQPLSAPAPAGAASLSAIAEQVNLQAWHLQQQQQQRHRNAAAAGISLGYAASGKGAPEPPRHYQHATNQQQSEQQQGRVSGAPGQLLVPSVVGDLGLESKASIVSQAHSELTAEAEGGHSGGHTSPSTPSNVLPLSPFSKHVSDGNGFRIDGAPPAGPPAAMGAPACPHQHAPAPAPPTALAAASQVAHQQHQALLNQLNRLLQQQQQQQQQQYQQKQQQQYQQQYHHQQQPQQLQQQYQPQQQQQYQHQQHQQHQQQHQQQQQPREPQHQAQAQAPPQHALAYHSQVAPAWAKPSAPAPQPPPPQPAPMQNHQSHTPPHSQWPPAGNGPSGTVPAGSGGPAGPRGGSEGGSGQLMSQHEALVSKLKQQLLQLNPVVQQQAAAPNSPFCCPLQCSTKGIPCIASPTTLSCVLSLLSAVTSANGTSPAPQGPAPTAPVAMTPPAVSHRAPAPPPAPVPAAAHHSPAPVVHAPASAAPAPAPRAPLMPTGRGLHPGGAPVARRAELDLELHL